MWHSSVLCTCIILGCILSSADCSLMQLANWNKCYEVKHTFLSLKSIPIKQCFLECQLRSRCAGANYWRSRKECELIQMDNVAQLTLVNAQTSCTSIAKSDLPEMSACSSCGDETVCTPSNNSCVIKECRPFTVDKGSIDGNRVQVGSKLRVVCDEYYRYEPLNTQPLCHSDGTWADMPRCVLDITCGTAPNVPNAMSSSSGNGEPGTVLTFACDDGYSAPAGNSNFIVTCLVSEDWTDVGFQCKRDCLDPTVIDNASLGPGDTLEGDVRHYTCFNNFITSTGSSVISVTCTGTGIWTTPTESCMRSCGEPPVLVHTSLSPGDVYEGSIRTYQCDAGYYLKRNGNVVAETAGNVTCTANGIWEGLVECVLVCIDVPTVSHATVQSVTGDGTPGTTTTYSCDDGYGAPVYKNDFIVTCQVTGDWTVVGFECKRDCSEPITMANSTRDTGDTLEGTTRVYTCWNSYITSSGSSTFSVTCTSTGIWTSSAYDCVLSCGDPPVLGYASISPGSVHEGSVRTYQCQTGYYIKRSGTVTKETADNKTCNMYGAWEGNLECVLECAESFALVTGPNGIGDSQITASSSYDNNFRPAYGRLDHAKSWAVLDNNVNEYIQFDFHSPKIVNRIITQGYYTASTDEHEWVKTYKILYSLDCDTFTAYNQIFVGNTESYNHVSNDISPPILARCIRIHAVTWQGWITMRIELMGC